MPEPDQIDAQLQLIAKMLVEARAPLLYGLTQLTVEAQELAVELALCLRGAIDTPRGHLMPARGSSLQLHGEARTTLGELRQYADLLVFVNCQPSQDLRVSFAIEGTTSLPEKQQRQLQLARIDKDYLATLVRGLACRNMDEVQALRTKLQIAMPGDSTHSQVLVAWQSAKYPVLVYEPEKLGKLLGNRSASYLIEQLERAVLARAKYGRAAAWPLETNDGVLSNAAGAEYVLTARTGYPAAVQCFSGCAEYLPGVSNAETLLTDGVIDAALFLGEGPAADWNAASKQHLNQIPTAIMAAENVLTGQACKYQMVCSELSREQGTIVREDGIPLPLAAKVAPANSTEKILRQLLVLVREPATTTARAAR